MQLLKGFWLYWWDCIKDAFRWSSDLAAMFLNIVMLICAILLLVSFFTKQASAQIIEFMTSSEMQISYAIALPILFVLRVAWAAFRKHDILQRDHAALTARQCKRLSIRTGSIADGCNWIHTDQTPPAINLRLAVTNEGVEEVNGCKAMLVEIARNSKTLLSGMNKVLTFAPAEDSDTDNKTIRNGIREHIDVIAVRKDGAIASLGTKDRQWPSFFGTTDDIFCKGDAILTISVMGEGVPTVTERFRLHIAPQYEESSLALVTSSETGTQKTGQRK